MFDRQTASYQKVLAQYQNRLSILDYQTKMMNSFLTSFPDISKVNVLSIGCGDEPLEKPALTSFLAQYQLSINYVGIDVNESSIAKCKKDFAADKSAQFAVINGLDCEKIQNCFKGEAIHIIVLRHPLLYKNNPAMASVAKCFNRILTISVPSLLVEKGVLLTSLYHPQERETFIKLMNPLSDQSLIELEESKAEFLWLECFRASFGKCVDIVSEVYNDRYFFAYPSFCLNLVNKIEIKNGCFDRERKEYQSIVRAIQEAYAKAESTENKTVFINNQLRHVIRVAVFSQGNIENIAAAFKEKISIDHPDPSLSGCAWELVKRGINHVDNEKRYNCFANVLVEMTKNGANEQQCQQALSFVLERGFIDAPIAAQEPDIVPTPPVMVSWFR